MIRRAPHIMPDGVYRLLNVEIVNVSRSAQPFKLAKKFFIIAATFSTVHCDHFPRAAEPRLFGHQFDAVNEPFSLVRSAPRLSLRACQCRPRHPGHPGLARSIQHTVRYTELSPTRFREFWRD